MSSAKQFLRAGIFAGVAGASAVFAFEPDELQAGYPDTAITLARHHRQHKPHKKHIKPRTKPLLLDLEEVQQETVIGLMQGLISLGEMENDTATRLLFHTAAYNIQILLNNGWQTITGEKKWYATLGKTDGHAMDAKVSHLFRLGAQYLTEESENGLGCRIMPYKEAVQQGILPSENFRTGEFALICEMPKSARGGVQPEGKRLG